MERNKLAESAQDLEDGPMRHGVLAAALVVASSGVFAQNTPDASFTNTQREGLRLFSQSCGVCHTVVQQRTRQYGPVLSRETLGGDEDLIREYISNGTPRMPGFRYYFEPEQISFIVQYIKTVAPPAPAAGAR
jgi:mono/diheme cytochrome c family protein